MAKLSEVDKKIIDKVISSIDWNQILKFYKILGKKIGDEQIKINGITRIEKVTESDAKNELYKVLEYMIENDLPLMSYGAWMISWTNGEWEITETVLGDDTDELEDIHIPIIESKLQVNFVPQSITVRDEIDDADILFMEEEEEMLGAKPINFGEVLNNELEVSIGLEDYILSAKIRDVIDELDKKKKK